MPKIAMKGADDAIAMLEGLGAAGENILRAGLFKGMETAANALRAAVQALPEEAFHPLPGASNGGEPLNVLTPDDKKALLGGIGISKFKRDGDGCHSGVSFDGYSPHASKRFPNGIPLVVIARSIESGASTRKKHPFVRPVVNRQGSKITSDMANRILEAVDEYTNNGALSVKGGQGAHTNRR